MSAARRWAEGTHSQRHACAACAATLHTRSHGRMLCWLRRRLVHPDHRRTPTFAAPGLPSVCCRSPPTGPRSVRPRRSASSRGEGGNSAPCVGFGCQAWAGWRTLGAVASRGSCQRALAAAAARVSSRGGCHPPRTLCSASTHTTPHCCPQIHLVYLRQAPGDPQARKGGRLGSRSIFWGARAPSTFARRGHAASGLQAAAASSRLEPHPLHVPEALPICVAATSTPSGST